MHQAGDPILPWPAADRGNCSTSEHSFPAISSMSPAETSPSTVTSVSVPSPPAEDVDAQPADANQHAGQRQLVEAAAGADRQLESRGTDLLLRSLRKVGTGRLHRQDQVGVRELRAE